MNKITSGLVQISIGLGLVYTSVYGPRFFGEDRDFSCNEARMYCIDIATNERVSFIDDMLIPYVENFLTASVLLGASCFLIKNGMSDIFKTDHID